MKEKNNTNFTIQTYKADKTDKLSVYVLSNDEYSIDEVIEYLSENYENHSSCELIEEQELSVAQYLGFKYCVIFHQN